MKARVVVIDDPAPGLARIKRRAGDAIRRALRAAPGTRPFSWSVRWLKRWRIKADDVDDVRKAMAEEIRRESR